LDFGLAILDCGGLQHQSFSLESVAIAFQTGIGLRSSAYQKRGLRLVDRAAYKPAIQRCN
jgi:hypothetical protein